MGRGQNVDQEDAGQAQGDEQNSRHIFHFENKILKNKEWEINYGRQIISSSLENLKILIFFIRFCLPTMNFNNANYILK